MPCVDDFASLLEPAGSSRPEAARPRSRPGGINVDGLLPANHYPYSRPRQYRLYVPDGLDPSLPAPLLVVLHGCQQSHLDIQAIADFDAIADREGFIVVYPYVTSYLGYRHRNCWGWWTRAHRRRGQGEVEDIRRLVDRVSDDYLIDARRIHICGLSSGAAMAVAALVAHGDCYASGASVAGVAYGEAAAAVGGAPSAFVRHKPVKALLKSLRRHLFTESPPPLLVVQSHDDTTVSMTAAKSLAETWRVASGLSDPDWQTQGVTAGVPWSAQGHGSPEAGQSLVELYVSGPPHGWLGGRKGRFSTPEAPCISELIWWHCLHCERLTTPAGELARTGATSHLQ